MSAEFNTYDDVIVSRLSFDARRNGWSQVPRQLLADWLDVVTRVAQAISPGYGTPTLPDTLEFVCETIASDGPYGSSENFYYLSYFSLKTDGLLIHFEQGRQGEDEPLVMEAAGLPYTLSSTMAKDSGNPARARFFVFHTQAQAAAVKTALSIL